MTTYYIPPNTWLLPAVEISTSGISGVLDNLNTLQSIQSATYLHAISKGDWYFTDADIIAAGGHYINVRLPQVGKFNLFDVDSFIVDGNEVVRV